MVRNTRANTKRVPPRQQKQPDEEKEPTSDGHVRTEYEEDNPSQAEEIQRVQEPQRDGGPPLNQRDEEDRQRQGGGNGPQHNQADLKSAVEGFIKENQDVFLKYLDERARRAANHTEAAASNPQPPLRQQHPERRGCPRFRGKVDRGPLGIVMPVADYKPNLASKS